MLHRHVAYHSHLCVVFSSLLTSLRVGARGEGGLFELAAQLYSSTS